MRSLLLIALLVPCVAVARTVTINYQQLPSFDCEGDAVALSDYTKIEFYFDSVPIPAAATDTLRPCAGGNVPADVMPIGVTPIPGTLGGDNSITTNLAPGNYFVRFRTFIPQTDPCPPAAPDCEWSQLSNQIAETVPPGSPKTPFIIGIDI